MKKLIYLSIGIASLTLVSFREQNDDTANNRKAVMSENGGNINVVKYVKFDHTDNSLGDPARPPKD